MLLLPTLFSVHFTLFHAPANKFSFCFTSQSASAEALVQLLPTEREILFFYYKLKCYHKFSCVVHKGNINYLMFMHIRITVNAYHYVEH